jgi:C-1 hydroxylase
LVSGILTSLKKGGQYFMSAEENKAIIRKFNEGYNMRNLDIFDELVAPDYHDCTNGLQGRENYKQLFAAMFQGFPDWHESIEGMIAQEDEVWVHIVGTGTHINTYDLFGIKFAPTGKRVTMSAVVIWRLANGKLVEGREIDDSKDFLRKLGLIEYTERGKQLFPQDD